MQTQTFTFKDRDQTGIFVYRWSDGKKPKAAVQISHGMAEHAGRYERFAGELVKAGYIVYANDHRGHGKTAVSVDKQGVIAKKDGFFRMMENMHDLSAIIKKENPNLPLFLFGHSMGSFLSQGYISQYGKELAGVILSGTTGPGGPILAVGAVIAGIESLLKGREYPSILMNGMSFGSYNNNFKPTRTLFDWLSRDNAEVDKYIADPFCGALFPSGYFYDLLKGLMWLHKKSTMAQIPVDLPIYLFSGSKDPVGKETQSVRQLISIYEKMGIKDLKFQFYDGGHHEMLNEINRDEVMKNVVEWLDLHC